MNIELKKHYDFSYLTKKILDSDFTSDPFKHIYIEDFFSEDHFNKILNTEEINSPKANNDEELIQGLINKGFYPIEFPGCVTDIKKYINWHENNKKTEIHSTCEGFGIALRLYKFQSNILNELNEFLASEKFNKAIAKKFGVDFNSCVIDGGIQKYLDGYEISPHPDIRKKAATFMVNINPSPESENMEHHTHYLKFKKSHDYVRHFWSGNKHIDRAWVPWSWTESIKQQTKNNSIVVFSPSDDTIHGVKTNYNHLITQRTQLYGNLWYKTNPTTVKLEWNDLDLVNLKKLERLPKKKNLNQKILAILPKSIKEKAKIILGRKNETKTGKRNI